MKCTHFVLSRNTDFRLGSGWTGLCVLYNNICRCCIYVVVFTAAVCFLNILNTYATKACSLYTHTCAIISLDINYFSFSVLQIKTEAKSLNV